MIDNWKLIGYHGTSVENALLIKENGFKPSLGENHWLDEGVYFFLNGISNDPSRDAMMWAEAQAWDNKSRSYIYDTAATIRAEVNGDENELLDLTTEDGLRILNDARNRYFETFKIANRRIRLKTKSSHMLDWDIIRQLKKDFGFTAVKCHFYFKFADQRIFRFDSRIPNVTVLCVTDTGLVNKNKLEIETTKKII